jgi:hypothetical protein
MAVAIWLPSNAETGTSNALIALPLASGVPHWNLATKQPIPESPAREPAGQPAPGRTTPTS